MNRLPEIKAATKTPDWLLPGLPSQALQPTAWSCCDTLSQLEILAAGFDPIGLAQMDAVALLDRLDAKFGMPTSQLLDGLAELQRDYRVLSINHQRLNHYRTLYFDTPNFDLYHAHVNERAERYKVRSREYTDSRLSYLEVKHKTRKNRTIKDRILTAQPVTQLTPDVSVWLQQVSHLDGSGLEPKLWNTFTRITLVSKRNCERVTLDVDLVFAAAGKEIRLDGIAIAEVKMDAGLRDSPFFAQMRAQKIRQQGLSKYCLGAALLYDQVKKNGLKPKMLWIEKMQKGSGFPLSVG